MNALRGYVLSARAWLVAVAVWLVAVIALDEDGDKSSAWAGGLLLVLVVGGSGLVRALWPMRVCADPLRLIAGGRPYQVATYTGRVSGASKLAVTTSQTTTTASVDAVTGYLRHEANTSQRTTVHDQFTLVGADGTQYTAQLRGVDLPATDGQLLSLSWAFRPGHRRGKYFFIRNHSTGSFIVPRSDVWALAVGGTGPLVLRLCCLWVGGILLMVGGGPRIGAVSFFVLPILYILLGYYQVHRLGRGSNTLVTFLDSVAATFG